MPRPVDEQVRWLKAAGSEKERAGLKRFAIPAEKAFGISVGTLRAHAKKVGRDHDLALALWKTGWYEARLLACFLGEPARLTSAQMDAWCRDFDNWAICDTACFALFDRSPLAWQRIPPWSRRRGEFQKRAAFALMASLAGHDKKTDDGQFADCLPMIERSATDDRNFVKKGVSWALRSIGHRSFALHQLAMQLAEALAAGPHPTARWVGKDALRDLTRPVVVRRLARKAAAASRLSAKHGHR